MSQNSKNLIIVLLLIGIGYLLWKFFFEKGIEITKEPITKAPQPTYRPLGIELVQQHFQPITPIPSTSVIGEVQLKTPTYTTSVVSAPTLAETTAPSVPILTYIPESEIRERIPLGLGPAGKGGEAAVSPMEAKMEKYAAMRGA